MVKFSETLRHAFGLLVKQPKLFLPKLLMAALFGFAMLWFADIMLGFLSQGFSPAALAQKTQAEINSFFQAAIAFFVFTLFAHFLDIMTNAMYPPMVYAYFKGKPVSLIEGIKFSFSRAGVVLPTAILSMIIYFILTTPVVMLMDLAILSGDFQSMAISAIVLLLLIFATIVIFYMLYPVATLEKLGILSTMSSTFKLGKKHFGTVSKASIFPFFISLVNIALAFLSKEAIFLAIFIFARFLTAVLYTYHLVLNPVIYLGCEKAELLKIGGKK